MLKPKDIIDRNRRKEFVETTDRISRELGDLLKKFPEYQMVDVTVGDGGYHRSWLANDNYIVERTGSGSYHPWFEVTVKDDADALAKEANNVS